MSAHIWYCVNAGGRRARDASGAAAAAVEKDISGVTGNVIKYAFRRAIFDKMC